MNTANESITTRLKTFFNHLPAGEFLPAKDIADKLDTDPKAISKALSRLAAEGAIFTRNRNDGGRGFAYGVSGEHHVEIPVEAEEDEVEETEVTDELDMDEESTVPDTVARPPAGTSNERTLVLMACCSRKKAEPSKLIDLLDGPMWQTLRKYRGNIPQENVFVLSAKYGFTCATTDGEYYNQELTEVEAGKLIEDGLDDAVEALTREKPFTKVIVGAGGTYASVYDAWIPELKARGVIAKNAQVFEAKGRIGKQRGMLGKLLESVTPDEPKETKRRAKKETK